MPARYFGRPRRAQRRARIVVQRFALEGSRLSFRRRVAGLTLALADHAIGCGRRRHARSVAPESGRRCATGARLCADWRLSRIRLDPACFQAPTSKADRRLNGEAGMGIVRSVKYPVFWFSGPHSRGTRLSRRRFGPGLHVLAKGVGEPLCKRSRSELPRGMNDFPENRDENISSSLFRNVQGPHLVRDSRMVSMVHLAGAHEMRFCARGGESSGFFELTWSDTS